ncbi:hypothetical protein BV22DRAFT_1191384 [Leucogyrophana mollusca]|uniref:Uncharacterized protein n=1 Tax=Leucogyrophana mollusca TaxID=85980 RepID=A0ACB8BWJ5_9AGAM|nr:hypothetical protein BV22DRAFT_1191384 [Leucogyrophana mollusca]
MTCFTQFDEDSYRLPEGVKRIAYDADTQRYTFRDRSGQLYQNAPGEHYGTLIPITSPLPRQRRVTVKEHRSPRLRQNSNMPAKTFDDFLPSDYITSADSGLPSAQPTPFNLDQDGNAESSTDRFVRVVRESALPKMQGVVGDVLRRSRTSLRRHGSRLSERRHLLGNDDSNSQADDGENSDMGHSRSMSELRPPSYSTFDGVAVARAAY